MIRKIRFNNFYSFNKEQEIIFLVTKEKKSYSYYTSEDGKQITKIAGFAGGNASGKTNVMRLFSFFRYLVCESSKDKSAENLYIAYKTFFNNNKPSNFYIEFEIDDYIFFYNFVIHKDAIEKETLQLKRKKKGAKRIEVFSRSGSIDRLHNTYFRKFPLDFLKKIRPDVSLLAFLKAHYDIDIINKVFNYFEGFKTNINESGEINNIYHQIKSLELYLKDPELKQKMENFICNFDIGLNNFIIKKEIKDKQFRISVNGVHTTKEKNNILDFQYESRGTQSLFFTLANILSGLKNNNVIIIDEIEAGFHPEALSKIINYFIDENEYGKSQIIFSSHSLDFMNKLDMHQIYLVKKDQYSESLVYRLNQVKGVRSDENFLSKYMTGAYGAFPEIRV